MLVCTVCAAGGLTLARATPARADGDPASDVLAAQTVFVPGDAGETPARERQLSALTAEAARAGFPVRVAIIAGPADLGSVTQVWGMPGAYARFLGEELSLVYRGELVVVMPQGFGVVRVGPGSVSPQSGVLETGRVRGPLGDAAEVAVLALARSAGHRLTLPAARRPAPQGSALSTVDAGSWVALAIGAGLIAVAWAASLRARPPSLRRAA